MATISSGNIWRQCTIDQSRVSCLHSLNPEQTMFTLASVASSLLQKLQAKTPILLVTDIGSDPDDILALLVLLASDLLKVEAIVTTGGDTLNRARVAARSFLRNDIFCCFDNISTGLFEISLRNIHRVFCNIVMEL